MRFPRNKQIFRGQLDVAAFAGVLFLLVIFILLHSHIVFTPGVPIRLPWADDLPGVIGHNVVVVAVDAGGQYYFDNQITQERLLQQRLQEEVQKTSPEPLTLIIQADKDITDERLTQLGLLARTAGISNAVRATRPRQPATLPR